MGLRNLVNQADKRTKNRDIANPVVTAAMETYATLGVNGTEFKWMDRKLDVRIIGWISGRAMAV